MSASIRSPLHLPRYQLLVPLFLLMKHRILSQICHCRSSSSLPLPRITTCVAEVPLPRGREGTVKITPGQYPPSSPNNYPFLTTFSQEGRVQICLTNIYEGVTLQMNWTLGMTESVHILPEFQVGTMMGGKTDSNTPLPPAAVGTALAIEWYRTQAIAHPASEVPGPFFPV